MNGKVPAPLDHLRPVQTRAGVAVEDLSRGPILVPAGDGRVSACSGQATPGSYRSVEAHSAGTSSFASGHGPGLQEA